MKPLRKEIHYLDPLVVFAKVYQQPWSIFLDSANTKILFENTNRYSYIAFDPFDIILCEQSDPFPWLLQKLQNYSIERCEDLPPFQGGLAGFLSYDLCHFIEKIPHALDDIKFPILALGLYDVVISFDHWQKRAWIVSTGLPEKEEAKRMERAKERLNSFCDIL